MTPNYFEFYGIPIGFEVDQKLLKKQFLLKSKVLHPDFHTDKSELEQENVLELSSFNNEAFKTLKNTDLRYKYVLSLKNINFVEGKETIPQSFLLEIMDLNEKLMELEFSPDEKIKSSITAEIHKMIDDLHQSISIIIKTIDIKTLSVEQLTKVKEYLLSKKYLDRILQRL